MLNNKSILITGGTGSFGKSFIKIIINKFKKINKLIIFSRDELKQYEMEELYPKSKYPFMRFFLGDVRDQERLMSAVEGVDYLIHAAALKQVPAAEYNPFEFVKTNVIGAQNIVQACLKSNVKKVISLSTDKAVSPVNLYGATKLCSDKIFLSANNFKGKKKITFSVVRYGNVAGSRGSVMPYLVNSKKNNKIVNLTDKKMTRFNISLEDGVEMVLWSLKNTVGGEIVIPKIPSYRIMDLLKATGNEKNYKIVGIRLGEKINEELLGTADAINTIDIGKYYITLPTIKDKKILGYYNKFNYKKLKSDFSYNSGNNKKFLSVSELKKIISNL
ncbi:UDP-N-acetylglucosamine 4,6-dehydratase (inverting) [Candidatus Pelagibacter sp.]|uniref:UDP-N-acetylglucosamine 4,6-dehydratase (inverting) n=1 Tax=Candidatus Pelagibacter sp. TaxID=2024849 RepID=UPI003F86055C